VGYRKPLAAVSQQAKAIPGSSSCQPSCSFATVAAAALEAAAAAADEPATKHTTANGFCHCCESSVMQLIALCWAFSSSWQQHQQEHQQQQHFPALWVDLVTEAI
jgi:hypothetical protein